MAMTVYETFAHALINEHGRELFLNKHISSPYGFRQKFWRLLILAYGGKLYDLPAQIGMEPPAPGRKVPYNFPAYTLAQTMRLGIAPTKAMLYPTMGSFEHQHTPIHLGTAMLLHGADSDDLEARTLLSVAFMKQAYPTHSASTFASNAYISPHKPQDVGMRPFEMEELLGPNGEPIILDELGNAAWFPEEYVVKVLRHAEHTHWYSMLCRLNALHGSWTDLMQRTSVRLLKLNEGSAKNQYRNGTSYLRNCSPAVAREWIASLTGVKRILGVARADATPQEMATGLATIVSNQNERTEEMFNFIGRPLTVEDFKLMSPKATLGALYYSPFGAIEEAVQKSSVEIGAMLFTLTDSGMLPLVTECMSPHSSRGKKWQPDTAVGNLTHLLSADTSPESIKKVWTESMKPLINDYDNAKSWRDEFMQLAPPEVLFCALCRWAFPEKEDPLPAVAIDNLLRSWSNITEIQNVIRAIPPHIGKLSAL